MNVMISVAGCKRKLDAVESEGEGGGEGGGARAEVGRLVDSSQADDRRMIRLVAARPLLYARNNMPVASYYAQVKALWQEVAHDMGWTVADVRRKWSHIRNSYSRHLRNEMYGVRTGRGRQVSRWYLADELDFLRDHMATDTRPSRYSYSSLYMNMKSPTKQEPVGDPADMDTVPFIQNPWFTALTTQGQPEPAPEPLVHLEESNSHSSFDPDENSSYFQFFRGIYNDYQELPAKKQRMFRRECLSVLHQMLDDEDGVKNGRQQQDAINLSNSALDDSEDERDSKMFIANKVSLEQPQSILPN